MLKLNPTTPIQFYSEESTYVVGEGNVTSWVLIESIITPAEGETPAVKTSVFYCEWVGAYGNQALSAQSMGVNDFATVRTFYNPTIYSKLKTKTVLIVKNADSSAIVNGVPSMENPNVYMLWGGVDNVAEENQFMEFKARRYEGN